MQPVAAAASTRLHIRQMTGVLAKVSLCSMKHVYNKQHNQQEQAQNENNALDIFLRHWRYPRLQGDFSDI
jgi:hypothetical protein